MMLVEHTHAVTATSPITALLGSQVYVTDMSLLVSDDKSSLVRLLLTCQLSPPCPPLLRLSELLLLVVSMLPLMLSQLKLESLKHVLLRLVSLTDGVDTASGIDEEGSFDTSSRVSWLWGDWSAVIKKQPSTHKCVRTICDTYV
jgi:hypothetical protein